MSNNKGFSAIVVLIGVVAIVGLVIAAYYFKEKENHSNQINQNTPQQTVITTIDKTASTSAALLTSNTPADWTDFDDPKGRFSFKYPSSWKAIPNGFHTPAGGLEKHSIGYFVNINEPPPVAKSFTVGVYEGYNQLSAYDFLKQEWCDDSLNQDNCLQELKIHANENGIFSVIEILYIIPGALGPAAWATHDKYGVFIQTNELRYTNKEDMQLFNKILSSFKFEN